MSSGKAFLVYSSLRLALLLAVGVVLYLVGARGLLLLVLAFLVSGALSLVLLDRSRGQMSAGVGRAVGKVNRRIDQAAAAEDDAVADADAGTGSDGAEGQPAADPKAEQQNAQ